jgi:glycosyltransferase involved in cell wall biosynthesis
MSEAYKPRQHRESYEQARRKKNLALLGKTHEIGARSNSRTEEMIFRGPATNPGVTGHVARSCRFRRRNERFVVTLPSVVFSGQELGDRFMAQDSPAASRGGVLIITQNASVPFDQRVWMQAQALAGAGYRVSVICPKGPGDRRREILYGVRLYRYEAPPAPSSVTGYVLKSAYCWARAALLSVFVVVRDRISVIQAASPPDVYWALAVPYRRFGVRFVCDQRDLGPELFRARFGPPVTAPARLLGRIVTWSERRSYRSADHVVVTNESVRQTALERGGLAPGQTTVVRSAPDTALMRPGGPRSELREGRDHLLVYRGSMADASEVDLVLHVLDALVHRCGRTDVHMALLGFGDAYEDCVLLCHALGLDDYVTFTGRAGSELTGRYLSTADVGICPNLVSSRNEVLLMEYLSCAVPVVCCDLPETRMTGAEAMEYVRPGPRSDPSTATRFADAVNRLLDDPQRRAHLAAAGRRRAETVLDWGTQAAGYIDLFDALSGSGSGQRGEPAGTGPLRVSGNAR